MPRPQPLSYKTLNSQQGAAPLVLVVGLVIVAALAYVYLRQTGTAGNAATAISSGAESLGNNAAAEYHEFRAENLAETASSTTDPNQAATDAAAAMDHKMQEIDARNAAAAQEQTAREQGAVVGQQVSESLANARSALNNSVDQAGNSIGSAISGTTN